MGAPREFLGAPKAQKITNFYVSCPIDLKFGV